MYGTLTLTVCYADKLVMTDYYGADLSETARSVICDSLDRIAAVLSTESGTISSEIPLSAPGFRTVPYEKARLERIGGRATRAQQKLLWDESGE